MGTSTYAHSGGSCNTQTQIMVCVMAVIMFVGFMVRPASAMAVSKAAGSRGMDVGEGVMAEVRPVAIY